MKKKFIIVFIMMGIFSVHPSFASYTITFDDETATDDGEQIGTLYDYLGIHFITDSTTLTDPGITFYRSTIVPPGSSNDIFWYPDVVTFPEVIPDDYFLDYYPYPETQYLAIDKSDDQDLTTGVALGFNYYCTEMRFNYRRPGANDRTGDITIAVFDISQSNTAFFTDQFTSYTFAPEEEDPDGDGWQDYTLTLSVPFNLVLLYSDKKFCIDNLSITNKTDSSEDFSDIFDNLPGSTPDDSQVTDSEDDTSGCFISLGTNAG